MLALCLWSLGFLSTLLLYVFHTSFLSLVASSVPLPQASPRCVSHGRQRGVTISSPSACLIAFRTGIHTGCLYIAAHGPLFVTLPPDRYGISLSGILTQIIVLCRLAVFSINRWPRRSGAPSVPPPPPPSPCPRAVWVPLFLLPPPGFLGRLGRGFKKT